MGVDVAAKKKDDELQPLFKKLEEALKKVPPEKFKEAEARANEFLKGDLSWLNLFSLPPEQLQQMAEIGYEQFKGGAYERAEKIFRGMTVIDPENYYYHQILGATYQREEKFPEAILEYTIAAGLNQKDLVSLTNRGECYLKLSLHPLALQDFEKAASLDSTGNDRWGNRARMLKEQVKLMGKKVGKKK